SQAQSSVPQPTPATITKKRGAKSGRVVITFALSERTVRDALNTNILWAISTEFTDPFAAALSKEGLSVTVPSPQAKKLDASPFAIIVLTSLSISDLGPYNGLNVAEVNGSLQAIDTDSTRSIRFNISRIRGFGNTQDQARRNALKNAADGVSESFIKQVAANAN
ncbi:MAG: hypothetical protein DMF72_21475, partial [Acidobacteria bacterium]